ncbi:MAG TPA: magnesium-translocating P-type ATPase, partial [bacterium]|nr:magnesium-translocating P-type ATPase [bacterium]
MSVMVVVIFAINVLGRHRMVDAFLFSLSVAVGLTPEMLPMIVTINLSRGAIAMARKKVIVKRLSSIQTLGAMDILCMDKTGTLTLDKVVLERYCDVTGQEDTSVLLLAYINSFYQTGLKNLLDQAILKHSRLPVRKYRKIDELPFDFSRKLMSVVVEQDGEHLLVTKGAPEEVFKRCTHYELDSEIEPMEPLLIADLQAEYRALSSQGFRVLAVAYRKLQKIKMSYSREDERDLILKGYLAFLDPPKKTARRAIELLRELGVNCKVLTGDNELVTRKICRDVGLDGQEPVLGDRLDELTDEELRSIVETKAVFTRLTPFQKERIIQVLRQNGHTVGFLGDGINDAPALHRSDVGISVDNAVDIAKESADIILLEKSLLVLEHGVTEGRKIFGNIIKYIKIGSSSNFGNMFSMTGASLFLPFLPMTPVQILLNNFLYDVSQVAIPTDAVDEEYLRKPRPWNVQAIRRFMVTIGPISSIFDFLTFGILLFVFHADPSLFHTGWFLESLCTQTLVIHVIRTSRIPFLESRPSRPLLVTSFLIVATGLVLPFTFMAKPLGFVPPPGAYFAMLCGILMAYLLLVHGVKTWFVRRYGLD